MYYVYTFAQHFQQKNSKKIRLFLKVSSFSIIQRVFFFLRLSLSFTSLTYIFNGYQFCSCCCCHCCYYSSIPSLVHSSLFLSSPLSLFKLFRSFFPLFFFNSSIAKQTEVYVYAPPYMPSHFPLPPGLTLPEPLSFYISSASVSVHAKVLSVSQRQKNSCITSSCSCRGPLFLLHVAYDAPPLDASKRMTHEEYTHIFIYIFVCKTSLCQMFLSFCDRILLAKSAQWQLLEQFCANFSFKPFLFRIASHAQ